MQAHKYTRTHTRIHTRTLKHIIRWRDTFSHIQEQMKACMHWHTSKETFSVFFSALCCSPVSKKQQQELTPVQYNAIQSSSPATATKTTSVKLIKFCFSEGCQVEDWLDSEAIVCVGCCIGLHSIAQMFCDLFHTLPMPQKYCRCCSLFSEILYFKWQNDQEVNW